MNRQGPGILNRRAAEAVQERLIERYAYFTERERILRSEGRIAEAEGAHRYATWVIRAYAAESRL